MKKLLVAALIQAAVIFLLTGLICLAAKENFFYRHLPEIVGILAGFFRFGSGMMIQLMADLQKPDK